MCGLHNRPDFQQQSGLCTSLGIVRLLARQIGPNVWCLGCNFFSGLTGQLPGGNRMLAVWTGKQLKGNAFALRVCVHLFEVWLIDAAPTRHLYLTYSELVKFRKNESGGRRKAALKESKTREIWWQNAERQARTSKLGPWWLWWRDCELSVTSYLNENQ